MIDRLWRNVRYIAYVTLYLFFGGWVRGESLNIDIESGIVMPWISISNRVSFSMLCASKLHFLSINEVGDRVFLKNDLHACSAYSVVDWYGGAEPRGMNLAGGHDVYVAPDNLESIFNDEGSVILSGIAVDNVNMFSCKHYNKWMISSLIMFPIYGNMVDNLTKDACLCIGIGAFYSNMRIQNIAISDSVYADFSEYQLAKTEDTFDITDNITELTLSISNTGEQKLEFPYCELAYILLLKQAGIGCGLFFQTNGSLRVLCDVNVGCVPSLCFWSPNNISYRFFDRDFEILNVSLVNQSESIEIIKALIEHRLKYDFKECVCLFVNGKPPYGVNDIGVTYLGHIRLGIAVKVDREHSIGAVLSIKAVLGTSKNISHVPYCELYFGAGVFCLFEF